MNPWWFVPAVGGFLVALEILCQKVEISGSERANKISLRVLEVATLIILVAIVVLVNALQKTPG